MIKDQDASLNATFSEKLDFEQKGTYDWKGQSKFSWKGKPANSLEMEKEEID